MRNSDRFLAAFNRIEGYLKEEGEVSKYESFSRSLNIAIKNNPMIRGFKEDLEKFSSLRNIIIHEEIKPNFVIAEPHIEVVERIEKIAEILEKPQKVIPQFEREVKKVGLYDNIAVPLRLIRNGYSQFPVYNDGKFMGLLSDKCIAKWLAHFIEGSILSIHEIKVEEVLKFDGSNGRNVRFVDKETTIYNALSIFSELRNKYIQVEAILITRNGRADESLLGIITPRDIVDFTE
jgi:CBS domain-containing protein